MTPTSDTIISHDEAALASRIRNTQRQYAEAQTAPRIIAALAETFSVKGGDTQGCFYVRRVPEGFYVSAKLYTEVKGGVSITPLQCAFESITEMLEALPEMHGVRDWYPVR